MLITETFERQCCDEVKDLVAMQVNGQKVDFRFCKYCGRHFILDSHMDASNSSREYFWCPLPWPWEKDRSKR